VVYVAAPMATVMFSLFLICLFLEKESALYDQQQAEEARTRALEIGSNRSAENQSAPLPRGLVHSH